MNAVRLGRTDRQHDPERFLDQRLKLLAYLVPLSPSFSSQGYNDTS